MIFRLNILLLLLFSALSLSFPQEKIELRRSDKLTGKTVEGKSIRVAEGNVFIVHGNVRAYCNTATQYLDENRVELSGNVRLFQDTLSLYTSRAVYFGNDSRAICEGGVTLKDPNATIRADNCVYSFNESKAVFKGDVIIINPEYRITSDELTYMRNTEDSFARSNVVVTTDSSVIKAEYIDFFKRQGKTFARDSVSIESDSTIIYSDTLTDYSDEKKSVASGNVRIINKANNVVVTGSYGENYERTNYSFIRGSAKLVQIDEKEGDTLFIYCNMLETFRNKPEKHVAHENVEVIRGNFLAKSDTAVFAKTTDADKEEISLFPHPVIWQDNLQLTGDSVYAVIIRKKISYVYAKKLQGFAGSVSSFMIVEGKDVPFPDRYDQITGDDIKIEFENDTVKFVSVFRNSNSVYFLYEDKKANGVNVVEGENMLITFNDKQRVSRIRVEKSTKGQYVPEVKISAVQLQLPGFKLRADKPVRHTQ